MAIGFKYGGSGVGAYQPNFKVIHSTSEPANPAENTIWIGNNWAHNGCNFGTEMPMRRSKNKNFATYPYASTTNTSSGVTFTDNGNGTITVNGTATKDVYFRGSKATAEEGMMLLPPGTYTISGCPSGGSESTYMVQLVTMDDDLKVVSTISEYGNGESVILTRDTYCRMNFYVKSGVKVSNLSVYFQVEKGSAKTAFEAGNANGQVWIKTGYSGTISFPMLKRNTKGDNIMVKPVEAYMYTKGGGWGKVNCKIRRNGVWVSLEAAWDGYYFKDGNQYTDVTGGWTKEGWGGTGSVTVGSTIVATGTGGTAVVGTANPVDLSGVNKVWIDSPNGTGSYGSSGYMFIARSKSTASSESVANVQINKSGSFSIDVSSLSGKYYIYLYAGTGAYVDARAIWGE